MNPFKHLQLNEFIQEETAECGLMCVCAIASLNGIPITASDARKIFGSSQLGTSANDLRNIGKRLGIVILGVKCSFNQLVELKLPAILHLNNSHFVVLLSKKRKKFTVFDPAAGLRDLSAKELESIYSGVSLTASSDNKTHPYKNNLNYYSSIYKSILSIKRGALKIILISALANFLALTSPLYIQTAFEAIVTPSDLSMLLMATIFFISFTILAYASELYRASAQVVLGMEVNEELSEKFFSKVINLPLHWFQRRPVSAIAQQFDSLEPVKSIYNGAFVFALFDGALAILLSIILILLSPSLFIIMFTGIIIQICYKITTLGEQIEAGSQKTILRTREQTLLYDFSKSVQTIKSAHLEQELIRRWGDISNNHILATARLQSHSLKTTATNNLIYSTSLIAIVFYGAILVSKGTISSGVFFAFILYRRFLSDKLLNSFSSFLSIILAKNHFQAFKGLLEEECENEGEELTAPTSPSEKNELKVTALRFAYSNNDRFIINGLSMRCSAGEVTAITGSSGAGKTTLLKVLAGLYHPTGGEIELNGRLYSKTTMQSIREHVGSVIIGDNFIQGSIRQNITNFSHEVDERLYRNCLHIANADQVLDSLPMRDLTPVDDRVDFISEGQKVQLLIARALYKKPLLLILDEVTSSLGNFELEFLMSLREAPFPTIVVTHNKSILSSFNQVLEINNFGWLRHIDPKEYMQIDEGKAA